MRSEQEGLGKLDDRALEMSGVAAQSLVSAQASAKASKAGLWSIEPLESEKSVSLESESFGSAPVVAVQSLLCDLWLFQHSFSLPPIKRGDTYTVCSKQHAGVLRRTGGAFDLAPLPYLRYVVVERVIRNMRSI